MIGTPLTHCVGFAAHHIPGFTLGDGPVVVIDPEPDMSPELLPPEADVDDAAFVTTTPDGATACHVPPEPWPFTCPARVSPEKRYSAKPW